MIANMLQGIMQSANESESDDDEQSDEDEAKKPATSDKQKRSSRDKERRKNRRKLGSKLKDELSIASTATEVHGQEMMMIMMHVNFEAQGDRAVRQGRSEQGGEHHSSTMRNTSQRKAAASPEASKNRCSCPAGASRWYGHQEDTVIANIEKKTAEVGRISTDIASVGRQPVQTAQFLHKEIDIQTMNRVVAALTTGIDVAVPQAQQVQHQQFQPHFQPQAQPQQLQTTFEAEQSLESETDLHGGEQDGQRHCRQQAGKVR